MSVSFNVYLTSRIGAEGMGLITLIFSVYGLFITLATSGVGLAVTRLVSASFNEDKSGKADENSCVSLGRNVKNGIIYALIFSVLASVVLYVSAENIGVRILGDKRTVPSLKLLSLTLVPIAVTSALNGYFNGVRRIYKSVAVQLCEQLVKMGLCAMLLIYIFPKSVERACLLIVVSGAVSELASLILSVIFYLTDRRIHSRAPLCTVKNIRATDGESGFSQVFFLAFPVGVSGYVRAALSTVEHIAIPWGLKKSGIGAAASLASYGILHGMVFPLLLFPSAVLSAFSSLLIPELSSSKAQGQDCSIGRTVSSVMALSLLFSLGVSGILISFSYEIGNFLYGSAEAGEYIRILAPLIPLMYLDGAVDSMLKGLGEQMYSMRVNIIDSALSVFLIVTLLPAYGIRGYVSIIFITELLNASLSIIRLLNITSVDIKCIKWILKPLVCVISATAVTRIIFDTDLLFLLFNMELTSKATVIWEIATATLTYAILTVLTGTVSRQIFNKIIKKRDTPSDFS